MAKICLPVRMVCLMPKKKKYVIREETFVEDIEAIIQELRTAPATTKKGN